MTLRILHIGILLFLAAPSHTAAQRIDPPTNASCIQDLYRAFGREHRLSRAVLFGVPHPRNAPVTSVQYDASGNAWVKMGNNQWQSPAEGLENQTFSDADMQRESEKDLLCDENRIEIEQSCVRLPRRGIIETKKTPTSDLVQPIVQTIRALQCRLRAVCSVATESLNQAPDATITVTLDGCLPMTFPVMQGCIDAPSTIYNTLPGSCQAARHQLITREMELLTLTASYDASYRSLAQFAGMFQEFLLQFRFPLIEPLWQMIRMFSGLNGVQCFQSECNE